VRKIWDIHGGIHPPENKSQSTQAPIGKLALPSELVIPLSQHIGAPAEPIVVVGQKVLKGECIGEAQGPVSANVHASSSGIISAIEDRPIPHASGLSAPCIVIETDGLDQWCPLEGNADFRSLRPQELLEKIRRAGIAGMGGAGFPSAVKLNPRGDRKIQSLILNGTECEPYITADDMLMRERAAEIVAGAEILAYILGEPKETLIGIEDNKPEAIESIKHASSESKFEVVSFPTKYPSGGEKQLIQILTGKEVPSGGLPSELGIVLVNVGTAAAIYRAIVHGEPLISRVTTVVGESLDVQKNVETLIGTRFQDVLNAHGFSESECARLIVGGPMMGFAMQSMEVPVIKTTNCILAPSHQELPPAAPAQACIRCGMCSEACPASLLPQQLYWFARSEDFDKLESHNLFDCIECGACSYVCPSNIPLVQYYRASKSSIRQMEAEKIKSDRSRARFEFRKERIARAEAEKEAKRLARKKAAEAAKQKNASKPAMAVAKKEPASPENQKAKLERALSSAQSRLQRAQQQLQSARDENAEEARITALEARLKEAEIKVENAKSKLDVGATSDGKAATTIHEKLATQPKDKVLKSIETLQKRIATAREKHSQAVAEESSNADALKQGVEKLESKLEDAKAELSAIESQAGEISASAEQNERSMSAAEAAIEKAKARAEASASMSDEEKKAMQRQSLIDRLSKAEARLEKAEQEGSEHVEAFRTSVEKLKAKLKS
jgi:electron transport complex protein RnfC